MAGYSFVITDGPDVGRTFELGIGITLLGRRDTPADDDPEGSVRWILTDPAVSRTHARIDWDGKSEPVLIHLSSTNATLLEGKIVTGQSGVGQSLSDGNRLRMGQTGIQVKEKEDTGTWSLSSVLGEKTEKSLAPNESWEVDGLQFSCTGALIEVRLTDGGKEAYILRPIDGQTWTTSLQADEPVVLQTQDFVRSESHKFQVSGS